MSIEQSFERIAVALEEIASQGRGENVTVSLTVPPLANQQEAPKKEKVKKPIAEKVEEKVASKDVTKEELTAALRKHATANGIPVTKALMIQHGANADTPTFDSLPTKNYAALYAAIV